MRNELFTFLTLPLLAALNSCRHQCRLTIRRHDGILTLRYGCEQATVKMALVMKVPSSMVLVFVLMVSGVVVPAQNVFQFAGYTFDQRNTPNQAALLGNSQTLGDAQFSSGLPTTTTGIIP